MKILNLNKYHNYSRGSSEVLAWLSVWSEAQMICIWSSWCHCHPIVSYTSKIQNGLPFWCWLTQVVLEKGPLNGCSSSIQVGQAAKLKVYSSDCATNCNGYPLYTVNHKKVTFYFW